MSHGGRDVGKAKLLRENVRGAYAHGVAGVTEKGVVTNWYWKDIGIRYST